MPYVRRDEQGRIVAVQLDPGAGCEEIPAGAPELAEFARRAAGEPNTLEQSDMRLVRVLEDLIELLIARDVIRFTDLPQPAQEKLLERRSMRQSLGALDLLGGDNETL
ncbi:MAG: hypothetical protein AB1720_02885 [Pseudomonadota bacterium]